MKILSIAYYHILTNFRDKKNMLILIGAPLLLIFILGSALGGAMNEEPYEMTLGLVLEETSTLTEGLTFYLDEVGKSSNISTDKIDDLKTLEALIIDGDINTGLYINKKNEIEIIGVPNGTINFRVTSKLVEGFEQMLILESIKGERNIQAIDVDSLGIEEHLVDFNGSTPSAMDYYAITMLAMFMMYGTLYGGEAIKDSYYGVRGERLQSTTVKFHEHFIGLSLGTTLTVFTQGLAIVLFSKYIYKVNFGENIFFIIFVVFSFALMATGLGMMVTVMAKDSEKGINLLNTLVPITTLISGGFVSIGNDGIIGIVQNFVPNHHLHEIMLNYVFETSDQIVRSSLIAIWIMIIVSYGGTLIFRRRTA